MCAMFNNYKIKIINIQYYNYIVSGYPQSHWYWVVSRTNQTSGHLVWLCGNYSHLGRCHTPI